MFFSSRLAIIGRNQVLKRTLATTQPARAGYTYLRTSVSQIVADCWHGHKDVRTMFSLLGIVCLANAFTWYHSAKDARFNFAGNSNESRWMKYMTEKQWFAKSGLGLHYLQGTGSVLYYGKEMHPMAGPAIEFQAFELKEAWRRDLYLLIVDIESYEPKACPVHPLPLGGCAHPANADSALTKVLKFEGKPLMYCDRVQHH